MKKMWELLAHFGEWDDNEILGTLNFDRDVWNRVVEECVKYRIDTIFLDCGEAIRFKTYPEFAVEGSWEPEEVTREVRRVREMGVQIMPKLNFSAAHDPWAQEYGRSKISTPEYYTMCRKVIQELYDIFDSPEYIHLGLDEESPDVATPENHFRAGEALLKDYAYLVDCVRETGATPCMWNSPFLYDKKAYDYFGRDVIIYSEMYYTYKKEDWTSIENQMDIVKNYYRDAFPRRDFYKDYVANYGDVPIQYIEQDPVVSRTIRKREEYVAHGYQVVVATSNIFIRNNDWATVEYYHDSDIEHGIAGYIACPWRPTNKEYEEAILEEIRLLGEAREAFYGKNE